MNGADETINLAFAELQARIEEAHALLDMRRTQLLRLHAEEKVLRKRVAELEELVANAAAESAAAGEPEEEAAEPPAPASRRNGRDKSASSGAPA